MEKTKHIMYYKIEQDHKTPVSLRAFKDILYRLGYLHCEVKGLIKIPIHNPPLRLHY